MKRIFVIAALASLAFAQPVVRPPAAAYEAPTLVIPPRGDLRQVIERYEADEATLLRFHDSPISPERWNTMRQFYRSWHNALHAMPFEAFGIDARIEWVMLNHKLDRELRHIDQAERRFQEASPLLPFAAPILELKRARQRVDPVDPQKAATRLTELAKQVEELNAKAAEKQGVKKTVARRAADMTGQLREALKDWFDFHNGYHPLFSWWSTEPYKRLDLALKAYSETLREKLAGIKKEDKDTILGDPVGAKELEAELASEMIPYSPEQLIAIARQEFAWCEKEMIKASREMGMGDDWRKALEKVKSQHVAPGEQPGLVVSLALEAIRYMDANDLITVPQLARDGWRVEMMSPERQRINPFFTGGPVLSVSFPTDGMSHEQKLMSMRGNNIHFARATVFHEVIPGHWLQDFMSERYRTHRAIFQTPFWTEGWALYWEMLLWDMGFHKTPENRVGALFWRMHRCARIIFSLSFHLEKMSAKECVDFLVDKVGHERENALAEVRRSFEAEYEPLYQCAYMIGALQFRTLNYEWTGGVKSKRRQFHDAVMQLGPMPVEMIRATLFDQRIHRDYTTEWKFLGEVKPAQ
ncbi:MAG: DUF885 family protein [Bryobacteraceae bacterium]